MFNDCINTKQSLNMQDLENYNIRNTLLYERKIAFQKIIYIERQIIQLQYKLLDLYITQESYNEITQEIEYYKNELIDAKKNHEICRNNFNDAYNAHIKNLLK